MSVLFSFLAGIIVTVVLALLLFFGFSTVTSEGEWSAVGTPMPAMVITPAAAVEVTPTPMP